MNELFLCSACNLLHVDLSCLLPYPSSHLCLSVFHWGSATFLSWAQGKIFTSIYIAWCPGWTLLLPLDGPLLCCFFTFALTNELCFMLCFQSLELQPCISPQYAFILHICKSLFHLMWETFLPTYWHLHSSLSLWLKRSLSGSGCIFLFKLWYTSHFSFFICH